jgi:guanylate kinase
MLSNKSNDPLTSTVGHSYRRRIVIGCKPVIPGNFQAAEMTDGGGVRQGRPIVLSGPPGVARRALVAMLRERVPGLFVSIAVTTRRPRPGEVDGRDHHFVTDAEFDSMVAGGALLEWPSEPGGSDRSGTPREPLLAALAARDPALVEADPAGARRIKEEIPQSLTVFLAPPDDAELGRRLPGRESGSAGAVAGAHAGFDLVVDPDLPDAASLLARQLTG